MNLKSAVVTVLEIMKVDTVSPKGFTYLGGKLVTSRPISIFSTAEVDCYNSLKLSEMLYFALKIVLSSKQAHKSLYGL